MDGDLRYHHWNNIALDLGVKYLGPPLAATDKQILEIHESVGWQELELKLFVEEMKCLQKKVQVMASAGRSRSHPQPNGGGPAAPIVEAGHP